MKIKKLLPIILSMFLFVGCNPSQTQAKSYKQVSMEEAVQMMKEQSGYIILDVRTPEEYSQGHIPNAINLPNENIGSADMAQLPKKDQLIFVYCRSGRRSKEAAQKLVNLGYTNIVEMGGILDWKGELEV